MFRTQIHTYLLNIITSTTHTLSHIKSQEFIGHIQKHFITRHPLSYITSGIQEFVKCCIKSPVQLDLRPANMLFGGLHPRPSTCQHAIWWTTPSTFDLPTCYLVDYTLDLRPANMLFAGLQPTRPASLNHCCR